MKYANAKQVDIYFKLRGKHLFVTYTDDGVGFDVESVLAQKRGHGLYNMQQRLKSLYGTLTVESTPGKGVRVSIHILS